jgi:hypothetical protein
MINFAENMKKVGWNVRSVELYHFASQSDCINMVSELEGLKEGVVVYNTLTKGRVKVKNAVYLAAHRLRGNGLTLNAICELVAMNEQDEYIATFTEDAHKFDDAIRTLARMEMLLINNYVAATHYMEQFEGLPTAQKEFALYVKDLSLSCVMFKARKEGRDIMDTFNTFPTNKKAEWIKEELLTKSEITV